MEQYTFLFKKAGKTKLVKTFFVDSMAEAYRCADKVFRETPDKYDGLECEQSRNDDPFDQSESKNRGTQRSPFAPGS